MLSEILRSLAQTSLRHEKEAFFGEIVTYALAQMMASPMRVLESQRLIHSLDYSKLPLCRMTINVKVSPTSYHNHLPPLPNLFDNPMPQSRILDSLLLV